MALTLHPSLSSDSNSSLTLTVGQYLALAENSEREGLFANAERIYQQLIANHPNQPDLLHRYALFLRSRGRCEESKSVLNQALALNPKDPKLHNTLGSIFRSLGQPQDSEQCYRRALVLDPGSTDAFYNLGVLYEDQQQPVAALSAYRQALKCRPDFAPAHTRIGALLKDQNDLAGALAHLDLALAASPGYFDALYYRGWVLLLLHQPDAALASYRQALAQRPDHFEATRAIANLLRDVGRHDEALQVYWTLMARNPQNESLHTEINTLAWRHGRQDLYLRSFAFARDKVGETPELSHLEAAFHLRSEDFVVAERKLRRAQDRWPERGDIAGLLARSIAGQRRFQESYPFFDQAVAQEPDARVHRQEYGFALLKGLRHAEAAAFFERSLVRFPFDQILLAGLTTAYREIGDVRYGWLVDWQRYVRVYEIAPPAGTGTVASFNHELAQELDSLHVDRREPIDQTLRGGTQTSGDLLSEPLLRIGQLRGALIRAVADYIGGLPSDLNHPTASRRTHGFQFNGSWSCRLLAGGSHRNHVHHQGWISSAYYARLPTGAGDRQSRQGWLALGQSNLGLGERDLPLDYIQPVVGRLVLFPSFYWHGTVPFDGGGDRVTVAFDVTPLPRRAI